MEKHVFTMEFEVIINPKNMPTQTLLNYSFCSDQEKFEHAQQVAIKIVNDYLSSMNQNWTWAKLNVRVPATTSNS